MDNSKFTLLLTDTKNEKIQSFVVTPDSEGVASIQLPTSLVTGKLEKFSVALTNNSESEVASWGIQLGTKINP
jgi:hypothetical protein